jgi:pyrimidine operon attenuation protein/uracil phosphoribosyltransferase
MMAATPAPRTLYIHDDLSEALRARGEDSPAWRLGQTLLAALRRNPRRIVILTVAEQLDALIARGDHAPFSHTIGIGRAGARVAAQIHARTGWFPSIHRVDVWREEDGAGGYVLAGTAPLAAQLGAHRDATSIAVVDDTIFSGLTIRTVLAALPPDRGRRTHAFCLRAVAERLEPVARLAPVTAGLAAPGRILEDVSFINASGLIEHTAIRRTGQPSLAFFERPEWIAAWFPGDDEEIIALCRQLSAELDRSPTP